MNDGRVVVVGILSRECGCWTEKRAFEGNAFRTNPETPLEICGRQVGWRGSNTDRLQCAESALPVTMAIRVLSAKPTNEISIAEMKLKEGTGVKM